MEDNKELMNEQAVIDAAEKSPANDVSEIQAKPDNAGKWGGCAVTKKFMTFALAAAILINAGVTAGVMALTAKHNDNDRPDMVNRGRPGSEMFSENAPGGNGQMAPPQKEQNNNEQKTPPADAQNNTQDKAANETEADS